VSAPEYVTEISVPPSGRYLQRLHSRMVEPEPLPEQPESETEAGAGLCGGP
jgi:hypothetical protein